MSHTTPKNKANVARPLRIPPDKFLITRRSLCFGIPSQHALNTHTNALLYSTLGFSRACREDRGR